MCYTNPHDGIEALGRRFFRRCLALRLRPCVVTKRTVFKWQETFWQRLRALFEREFRPAFVQAGLLGAEEELSHLLSDAATMCIVGWAEGGFGFVALNYDGDLLTDELAEVHGGPAFISSVLHGVPPGQGADEEREVRMYEACHGTIADEWQRHSDGEATRVNPLGLAEALLRAMADAEAVEEGEGAEPGPVARWTERARAELHAELASSCLCPRAGDRTAFAGEGCAACGKAGWTTESLIGAVAARLHGA